MSEKPSIRLKNKKGAEKDDTYWNDKLSRVGVSLDGVPLVYSLPGLLLAPEQVGNPFILRFPQITYIYSGALVPSA